VLERLPDVRTKLSTITPGVLVNGTTLRERG